MTDAQPQKEHHWLARLVGAWTYESECTMGPDQPPMKMTGSEVVRSLGGLWTVGEATGDLPDGGAFHAIMTLGYDPVSGRFMDTFIASMMPHLWLYNGALDANEQVLTLDSEGPSCTGDGTMAKYQDIIEFISDNHRTLASQFFGEDGQWHAFMKAHYQRTKEPKS